MDDCPKLEEVPPGVPEKSPSQEWKGESEKKNASSPWLPSSIIIIYWTTGSGFYITFPCVYETVALLSL